MSEFPVFSFDKSNHAHEERAPAASAGVAPSSSLLGQKPAAGAPAKPDEQKPDADKTAADKTEQQKQTDGVSEELRAYREQRRQETPFYDPTKDFRDSGLEESANAAGLVGKERDATINEQKRILSDFQFTTGEAKEVVSLVDRYAVAPPDEATAAAWASESWDALVRQHGQREANAMLADAQKLVARDPRVKLILEKTGLGNHPKLVQKLVSLARSEKGRGRLK
jgi:hypothetical protein